MRYRRDIEGLRAIAVVAVLLYHFGVPGIDGGFVGVDVFFVISGYLITTLLIEERQNTGRVSIKAFYARRARRLLPISATVIVATSLAGVIWLSATRIRDLAEEVLSSAFFGANILFADRGTDYLTANLAPSPLRHYWSLAVEEQFYFVWPALIALVTIGASNVRQRVTWAMAAIVIGSYAASGLLTAANPSWSYFGLHTRAWELGVGALLAALAPTTDRWTKRNRAIIGWSGLAAVVVSVVTFGEVVEFPGWAAALPVLGTGAMLVGGNKNLKSPLLLLRHEPFLYLGARSYSLYLWHWPVLVIAEAHLRRTLRFGETLAAVALVFALAELGFRFIEDPIRSSRPLARRTGASLAMGGALVAVSLLAGVVLHNYHPDLSTGVVAAAPDAITTTTSSVATTVPASAESTVVATTTVPVAPAPISMNDTPPIQAVVDALANEVVPDNLRPGLLAADNDTGIIYGNGCHLYYDSVVTPTCVFGDVNGEITIALWGDSHAAQWFTALDAIATTHHWRLLSLTQGGCPYLDVEVYNNGAAAVFTHCAAWRESVRAYLREQSVDVVFVSQFYALTRADDRENIGVDDWQAHLPELLAGLRADGIEPVVIGDTPNPPQNVPDCVADHRHDISACAGVSDPLNASAVDRAIGEITATSGVSLVQPLKWICAGGTCPAVVGDILVYRDSDHLTNTFMQWLIPAVEAVVVPFVEATALYRRATARTG
ncbi:MAG: acyltransferase family protein [Actinomycetota bacterium]|nr:acyltransferase family protein [Actinomycetota bacterium]